MDTDPLHLRTLPRAEPPADLWPALAQQLAARHAPRRRTGWLPLAFAAGLALAALGVSQFLSVVPDPAAGSPTASTDTLRRLQASSAGLEAQLDAVGGGMLSAPAADAIARLERELAWLDLQLGERPDDPVLWAERVALLGGMLQRYLRDDWRADLMLASY